MTKTAQRIEIGLLYYPDCLESAIYGLNDLFRIANMVAETHDGFQRPLIRISQWRHNGTSIECIKDTHPHAA
ncbi:MAG: AraC family transcriptional regulator, partial [Micavibrio aeruginosavorus]